VSLDIQPGDTFELVYEQYRDKDGHPALLVREPI